jgi:hypothetical protein
VAISRWKDEREDGGEEWGQEGGKKEEEVGGDVDSGVKDRWGTWRREVAVEVEKQGFFDGLKDDPGDQ